MNTQQDVSTLVTYVRYRYIDNQNCCLDIERIMNLQKSLVIVTVIKRKIHLGKNKF
jgi:hypothetical protein